MNRCAIPDDQQCARDLSQQMAEEGYYLWPTKRLGAHLQQAPPARDQGLDDSQTIMDQRYAQDRHLTTGRLRLNLGWY